MSQRSTKPYILRALYEWCADNGFTPHLLVAVNKRTVVPQEYVRDGQIVLNISSTACRDLRIDNDWVTCSARFGGVPRQIEVPMNAVAGLFARENGEGMAFPLDEDEEGDAPDDGNGSNGGDDGDEPQPPRGRPSLKIVK